MKAAFFRAAFLGIWLASVAGGCGDDPPREAAAEPAQLTAELRCASCAEGAVAPRGYAAITEIPTAGIDVFAQDVNDDGVVAGSLRAADGNWHAFRYTARDGVQDLTAQPGFGAQSFGSAIAEDGAVGGHSDHADGTGTLFGYRYTDAGGRGEVCPTVCSVWDLDARGRVVGLIADPSDASVWQAFLFAPAAGLLRLGTLGGLRSSASGISPTGLVVGNSQIPGSAARDVGHAFVYDAAHGMRDLNALARDAEGWVLEAANDATATQIAGYGARDGAVHAFLYDIAQGRVRDLGAPAGDGASYGWALNGHGDVVGYAVRDAHLNDAFIYSANLGMRRLGDFVDPALGWDLQQATSINDHGLIVGWGYKNGVPRAYELALPQCERRH